MPVFSLRSFPWSRFRWARTPVESSPLQGRPAGRTGANAEKSSPSMVSDCTSEWGRAGDSEHIRKIPLTDDAVLALWKRIKAARDQNEVRKLSDQLERLIFHKRYVDG